MGDCQSTCVNRRGSQLHQSSSITHLRSSSKIRRSKSSKKISRNSSKRYAHSQIMTESDLKKELTAIFNKYDKDKDGCLNVDELRDMMNAISQRKHNNKDRFKAVDMSRLMSRMEKGGETGLTKEDLYQFYKSI